MKKISQSQKGFTLIELIGSMFIMVMISGILVANYKFGEKKRRTALSADGIVNAIRLTQNYAQSGKQIDQSSCPDKSAKTYRMNFDSSSDYVLFAEDNCANPLFEIQRFKLVQQTQMKAGELKLNSTSVNSLSLMFTPPFATITASGNGGAYAGFSDASVGVEFMDGTTTKSVTIDGVSGRVGE